MKKMIDCTTGEETEVEITAKDKKQQEIDEKAWLARESELAARVEAKQAALAKLGLSAEDAAAIFG
jgi:hypothetical protein